MKKKLLIIEDELYVRDIYERVLKKAGFQVSIAIDGKEGLKRAQNLPDLILLDIMLPKVNGIDVLRRLKKDKETKDIPVILLSNLGQESVIKEAFKIGAEDYILKINISPFDLVDKVKVFFRKNEK